MDFWEGAQQGFNAGPDLFTLMQRKRENEREDKRVDALVKQVDIAQEKWDWEKEKGQIAQDWTEMGKSVGLAQAAHDQGDRFARDNALSSMYSKVPDGLQFVKIGATKKPGSDNLPDSVLQSDQYLHLRDGDGNDIYRPWGDNEAGQAIEQFAAYLQGDQFYKDRIAARRKAIVDDTASLLNPQFVSDKDGTITHATIMEHDPITGTPTGKTMPLAEYNVMRGLPADYVPVDETLGKTVIGEGRAKVATAESKAAAALNEEKLTGLKLSDYRGSPERLVAKMQREALATVDKMDNLLDKIKNADDEETKQSLRQEYADMADRLELLGRTVNGETTQLTAKELVEAEKAAKKMWAGMDDVAKAEYGDDFETFYETERDGLLGMMRKEKEGGTLAGYMRNRAGMENPSAESGGGGGMDLDASSWTPEAMQRFLDTGKKPNESTGASGGWGDGAGSDMGGSAGDAPGRGKTPAGQSAGSGSGNGEGMGGQEVNTGDYVPIDDKKWYDKSITLPQLLIETAKAGGKMAQVPYVAAKGTGQTVARVQVAIEEDPEVKRALNNLRMNLKKFQTKRRQVAAQ